MLSKLMGPTKQSDVERFSQFSGDCYERLPRHAHIWLHFMHIHGFTLFTYMYVGTLHYEVV